MDVVMLKPVNFVLMFLFFFGSLTAEEGLHFFEQKVRPLLVEHCYSCHSVEEKIKGGLALDSKQGWQQGGDSGPAIIPGHPDTSLLIKAVSYLNRDLEMPPKGKLPKMKIEILRKWIAMGAPDPRNQLANSDNEENQAMAARDLWSFQPLKNVTVPTIGDPPWAGNDIDRFVKARLDAANLTPALPAPNAILLRRLYLELTGLPPTPQQLEDFEKDNNPERVTKVVDELLASEGFGDRWGRHWLDLTAYADTIGVGRSIPATDAWRYRDYVITSFNADKPFNEFIRQQISGDIKIPSAPGVKEGPDPTAEDIIATGFLAIGPWELVSGDKKQLRMDVVDRQINRVGKAFLGMTLECARCHGHKFDPISQEDYFALAGIFRSTVTLNGRINGVFSDINKTPLPESPEELIARAERMRKHKSELNSARAAQMTVQKIIQGLDKEIDDMKKRVDASTSGDDKSGIKKQLDDLEKRREQLSKEMGQHRSRADVLHYLRHSENTPRAYAVMDTWEPESSAVNIRGSAHQLGPVIPRGFPKDIAPRSKPSFTRGGSGRVQLAEWIAHKKNPLTTRVWVNRVWHHLFGTGLVRTVDNFGAMGEAPSHPELLDYLAAKFINEGWSTKQLIREIVLTRTWQQSSTNSCAVASGATETDPNNRLLWRANRKRLEAEVLRDMMLFVSGKLDNGRGGPSLPFKTPGSFSPGGTGSFKDSSRISSHIRNRRTIYLPQKRKAPFVEVDFIQAFDLPDNNHETGKRTTTAVPTQALYLANSPFVQDCGKALAKRFAELSPKDRVIAVYHHALNREPLPTEIEVALNFVQTLTTRLFSMEISKLDAEEKAWARFCHSILMTNEFLFRS